MAKPFDNRVFKAISSEARRSLLSALRSAGDGLTSTELLEIAKLSIRQQTLSEHLRVLEGAGLISIEKKQLTAYSSERKLIFLEPKKLLAHEKWFVPFMGKQKIFDRNSYLKSRAITPQIVWISPAKRIYHEPNSPFFGTTSGGAFSLLADALVRGYSPPKPASTGTHPQRVNLGLQVYRVPTTGIVELSFLTEFGYTYKIEYCEVMMTHLEALGSFSPQPGEQLAKITDSTTTVGPKRLYRVTRYLGRGRRYQWATV